MILIFNFGIGMTMWWFLISILLVTLTITLRTLQHNRKHLPFQSTRVHSGSQENLPFESTRVHPGFWWCLSCSSVVFYVCSCWLLLVFDSCFTCFVVTCLSLYIDLRIFSITAWYYLPSYELLEGAMYSNMAGVLLKK